MRVNSEESHTHTRTLYLINCNLLAYHQSNQINLFKCKHIYIDLSSSIQQSSSPPILYEIKFLSFFYKKIFTRHVTRVIIMPIFYNRIFLRCKTLDPIPTQNEWKSFLLIFTKFKNICRQCVLFLALISPKKRRATWHHQKTTSRISHKFYHKSRIVKS